MPTENRRIATYLPKYIDDRLEAFKSERSIKGDSQALIVILSEFLEVSQQATHQVDYSGFATKDQLEVLTSEVNSISEKLSELSGKLLSELPTEIQDLNERINLIQLQTLKKEHADPSLVSSLPSELPNESPKESLNELPNESLGKLPGESLSEPNVELIESVKSSRGRPKNALLADYPGTLPTGKLAERLGIHSTTLSKWKPKGERGKSTEEMLEATRKEDPEGIGWTYLPQANRFKPEREPSSDSPIVLQSELLEGAIEVNQQ